MVPTIPLERSNRTLSAKELKAYLDHLGDGLPDEALRLALLAGRQRMVQLPRTEVGDYDAHTETLRLFDPKGKRTAPREHLLPRAPKAARIVDELVTRASELESPWLFAVPGAERLGHEVPGKWVAEICDGMKGESFN